MENNRKQKITLIGAVIILACMTYSPNIRYITNMAAKYAHQAAWLVPAASLVLFVPLYYVLYKLARGFEGQSLHDMTNKVFGKIAGKIICTILLLWLMILLGLYTKYSGEKLVSTVYVGTDIRILLFLLVVLVGIILRSGLKTFSRMNKFIFVFALAQFLFLCISMIATNFSFDNITPISASDIVPIARSIPYPISIWVYFTLFLIFNDQIQLDKRSPLVMSSAVAFIVIVNTILLFSVVGTLGWELTDKIAFPFLKATENIQLGSAGGAGGFEAFFISIWMILEFVIVFFFVYTIVRLIRDIFRLNRPTPVLTAVLGFGYFFAIYICNDSYELFKFSEYIVPPVNLTLGLVMPVLLFITAKVRKLI